MYRIYREQKPYKLVQKKVPKDVQDNVWYSDTNICKNGSSVKHEKGVSKVTVYLEFPCSSNSSCTLLELSDDFNLKNKSYHKNIDFK